MLQWYILNVTFYAHVQIYLQDMLDMKLLGPKYTYICSLDRYGQITVRLDHFATIPSSLWVFGVALNVSGLSLQAVSVGEAALLHWHLLHLCYPVLRPSRDHHPLLRVPRAWALGAGGGPVGAHHAGLPDMWVEYGRIAWFVFFKGTWPPGLSWGRVYVVVKLPVWLNRRLGTPLFQSWGVSRWLGQLMIYVLYRTWGWGLTFIYQYGVKCYRGGRKS